MFSIAAIMLGWFWKEGWLWPRRGDVIKRVLRHRRGRRRNKPFAWDAIMRLRVVAPDSFAALDLLEREAHGVELTVGTETKALRKVAARADAVLVAPRHVS